MNRNYRRGLLLLNLFLAFTALGGGIALLSGYTPPLSFLESSPFESYRVPAWSLIILVAGSATVAVVMILRGRPGALLANMAASGAILIFEFVEIATIGSPPGAPRVMQILYLIVGLAIALFAWRATSSGAGARSSDGSR